MVLAIIGLIMSLGLPAVQSITTQRINSTTRRFTGLVKTVRNDAILLNLIHRLVINLDDQQWWVEQQQSPGLLADPEVEADDEEGEAGRSPFVYADKYNDKPKDVPPGVRFDGVLTEQFGMVKEGVVYVHFFPNGFVEQSILYLARASSPDVFYSLILRPTAGRVEIVPGAAEGF